MTFIFKKVKRFLFTLIFFIHYINTVPSEKNKFNPNFPAYGLDNGKPSKVRY